MFDEKYLKSALMKQELELQLYNNKRKREEELLGKQQQYARVFITYYIDFGVGVLT